MGTQANTAADTAARLTLEAFEELSATFTAITRRAQRRFEERDWAGARRDGSDRLDLYDHALFEAGDRLGLTLREQARDQAVWVAAKRRFGTLVTGRYDLDRAETFFNSVTRRMLGTVGVNRDVEFFYLHSRNTSSHQMQDVCRTYPRGADSASLVRTVLLDCPFRTGFVDIDRDAGFIAREIDLHLWPITGNDKPYSLEVAHAIFYRNKEAYVVGRIVAEGRVIPMVIPMINGDAGIYADTVLLRESEVSIVFSFAYSYFLVDVERYDTLIQFLGTIVPGASLSDLYTALGYNRHGKTEFYRDLHRFVHLSREQFVIAPGLEGAVMIVFTLPHYDFVFKVIKDRPCFLRSPKYTEKTITHDQVRHQYAFVSHRDRAGRMVDTQEFENLRFKRKRFSEELLNELVLAARDLVTVGEEYVVLRHLYVQQKVVPLPIFFDTEKEPETIRCALIDFGDFLKDLAASGVFPCDLFNTWNYGVTHWGRVVLFDYDDVLPIEQISFREKPAPRDESEETAPEEAWIFATDEMFFMDELDRYSGVPGPLKGIFRSVHGDLYTLEFWDTLKSKLRNGDVFDVTPYDRTKSFHLFPR